MKSCNDCAFCTKELTGYSEYTITGCISACMGNLNPGFPFDDEDYHGEGKRESVFAFANGCEAFIAGTNMGLGLGVDDPKVEFAEWAKQFQPSPDAADSGAKK